LLIIVLIQTKVHGFVELSLSYAEPIFKGGNEYATYDKLKLKKVNRTTHLLIGEYEYHVPIGNDFGVRNIR
jgi:hypothetical protein